MAHTFYRSVESWRADVEAWTSAYLRAWQTGWEHASEGAREHGRQSIDYPGDEPSFTAYLRANPDYPFAATALIIHRQGGKGRPGVRVIVLLEDGEVAGDAPPVERIESALRAQWSNLRDNWTPERSEDPPPEVWQRTARSNRELAEWIYADDFTRIPPEEVVAHALQEPKPEAPPVSFGSFQHVHDAKERQEDFALATWMGSGIHQAQLCEALGIPGGPCWFATNVPRRLLFDGRDGDGDFDLLMGHIDLTITEAAWAERRLAKSRASPLRVSRGWVDHWAYVDLIAEGAFEWPPSVDDIAAVEVKSSWFDGGSDRLKRTMESQGTKVLGQIDRLLKMGVDRVAFLHLATTKPRANAPGNPWANAEVDMHRILDELPTLQELAARPECGYLTGIMAAVPHAPEWAAGSSSNLLTRRVARPNPKRDRTQAWRSRLREVLASYEKPRTLPAMIRFCTCGRMTPHAPFGVRCTCGRRLS